MLAYQQQFAVAQHTGRSQCHAVRTGHDVKAAAAVVAGDDDATGAHNRYRATSRHTTTQQSRLQRAVVGSIQLNLLPAVTKVGGAEHVATQTPDQYDVVLRRTGHTKPGAVIGQIGQGFPGITKVR